MIDESLEEAYEKVGKRLDKIEHANEIRLKNDIEKNKEIEKRIKQMQETIEIPSPSRYTIAKQGKH